MVRGRGEAITFYGVNCVITMGECQEDDYDGKVGELTVGFERAFSFQRFSLLAG